MTLSPPHQRAYLAHPMGAYGGPEEATAIAHLGAMGYTVINPAEAQYTKACGSSMERWIKLASACDLVVVLTFADGKFGAGAAYEAETALAAGKPVFLWRRGELSPLFKLPCDRVLSPAMTRARNDRQRRGLVRTGICLPLPDTSHHPDLLAAVTPRHSPRHWR